MPKKAKSPRKPRGPKSEYVLVYITASDAREANNLKEALLKERLVACVNSFPIQSAWWWKGKIEQGAEVALIAKTKREFVKDIIRDVNELHGYEVPCVLVLPVLEGNPGYLKWVDEVTLTKEK